MLTVINGVSVPVRFPVILSNPGPGPGQPPKSDRDTTLVSFRKNRVELFG